VDTTGHARITDFGLYAVTHNLNLMRSTPAEHGHNARWIAPEILDYRGTYSKQGDIFSFAMVVIEVRHDDLRGSDIWLTFLHLEKGVQLRGSVRW